MSLQTLFRKPTVTIRVPVGVGASVVERETWISTEDPGIAVIASCGTRLRNCEIPPITDLIRSL